MHKIEMDTFLEDARHDEAETTFRELKDYEDLDDPRALFMLYQHNRDNNAEYELMATEVTAEYKTGILDPSRTVGKAERKRGAARRIIQQMKRKYAKMVK